MLYSSIWKKFPWYDRMLLFSNCCKKNTMYADFVNGIEPQFKFKEEFKEDIYNDFALKLTVKETGSLEMNKNILHPFVKIHVVDMNTGKYLAKSDRS